MAAIVERALGAPDADDILAMSDELTARISGYWIGQRDLLRAISGKPVSHPRSQMKSEYDQRIIDMFKAGNPVRH